nr:hypothetical protein [Tanacetum cinerariifolium]
MSAMANTTPLVTTVTKPATNPKDADATPRVNIQELCEEYYEDILPIIMDKVRRDKRKDVHTRLDFGEGHRRQSAFDRLSETYPPSTTKSRPRGIDSRDHPRGRSRPHRLDTSNEDCPKDRERFRGVGESYDDSFSHSYRDRNRYRHMKRRRDNKSPLSSVSKSDSSDGRTQMPNNVKTYDGTGDPEDHVKIFQAAAQVERWAMPTWCHMFNSTLIGATRVWFDELPPKSINSYKDLKTAFMAYFMQQKKYVKDPVEIHNVKQKDGETIEDFIERFKVETGRMKGAPECMQIFGFMHGVNNPELTKRLNEHVSKTMEEIMITTTAFIRGEAAAASKKKGHTSWKAQDQSKRQTSEKRTLKEILAAEAGKFQPPPPMMTPVEKRSSNKFCDFHNDKRHSTDECMQLKKQIEKLVREDKLSHLIKEIKHGRDQSKTRKKETPAKDKPTTIYMIQSWQRMTRQKVTQSFERVKEIMFPPLTASSRMEGPLVIEAEMGGHMIHRMYMDGGSLMEILYEHCYNRLRPKIKNQMVPATTSLTGFSGETIWQLDIIGRPRIREIQAVPSTAREMFKFPVEGRIVTIRSTILIPTECTSEVAIGGTLSKKGRIELCSILKKNLDIFAWKLSDMTGVPRSVAEHRLNIREGYSPVQQNKKGQTPERAKAIQAEDCYPLPEIDWKVESLCGYPFKCFLDAYKGYHQIQLAEPDEDKTSFHIGQGVYCYTKMSFGLKNAVVTYQRPMDKAFDSQIGRNIEVYIDDLVVKSYTEAEMLRDIDETRSVLGICSHPDGIKPCPDKTAVVLQLPSPRTIKEVQSLNGKLASLNRFLSKSAKKSLPLFKTLKKCIKKSDFHWTAEAEQAFKQPKQHLSELPLLVAPKPKEELIIYLFATYGAISAVLMTERGATQMPIYFISRALQGPKLNYTPMKKLVLSLVFAAKRLLRTAAKIECHARRTQYHVPAKNVGQRTDPGGFSYRNTGRKPTSHASGRNSTKAVDTLHGWLIMSSNNEAEYEALIAGLRIAAQMGVQNVHEGGKKAPHQGSTVRIIRGNSLQAVVPYAVVKMCWTAQGGGLKPVHLIHERNTRVPEEGVIRVIRTLKYIMYISLFAFGIVLTDHHSPQTATSFIYAPPSYAIRSASVPLPAPLPNKLRPAFVCYE